MKVKNIIIMGLVAAVAIAVLGLRVNAKTSETALQASSYQIVETTDLKE